MSEKEAKRCPKCGGEMEIGRISGYATIPVRFIRRNVRKGDVIVAFYCKNCGYIELYKEMKR